MADMFRAGWVFYYDYLEAAILGKEPPTWQGQAPAPEQLLTNFRFWKFEVKNFRF